jgi:carbonic anhydrase/acetyltransferase-like protein (isoleucine patch superfamily)
MQFARYSRNFVIDVFTHFRTNLGRMIRETGLDLDRRGCVKMNDISCFEQYNRHRNILPIHSQQPVISSAAYVAPNATIVGDVFVAKDSYFGFGSVAQGIDHAVRVGENTKIGDNTVLESVQWAPEEAFPLSLNIGNNVNIEHSCNIRSSIIDDNVHIGFRSVVMEGAQLERGSVIAPNSTVPAGSRIPENTLWAGNPVRFVKNLEPVDQRIS